MKKFNKSFLYKISSLCIALGGLIYAQGMCMMIKKKGCKSLSICSLFTIYKSPLFMISYNEDNIRYTFPS